MNLQFERQIARYKWWFVLAFAVLVFASMYNPVKEVITEGIPAPEYLELEWLYVQKNNVLVWPVVNGTCRRKGAVAQYHQGEMVLVVARAGPWVEVESEDQTRLHTHGCISETMLGPEIP